MNILPIETFRTLRNGEWIDLHRCGQCTRAMWYATGNPPLDNGFTPANRELRHHNGCPNSPKGSIDVL